MVKELELEDVPSDNMQYSVALPCDPTNFSKFISSLLGKPQTITKAYSGSFEIRYDDIENVYHLISQRIVQQNKAELIQFTIKLVFDDNSSILLDSLSDFKTYAEVRPLVVTQIHLSSSFLVQFENKEHPEKQEIEISYLTRGLGKVAIFDSEDSPIMPLSRIIGGGHIRFRISHTARTWGADMESLLSGYIRQILLPEPKIRAFIRTHSGKIAAAIAALFFISTLIVCFYSADKIGSNQIESLKPILENSADIDIKLNKILDMLASGFWGSFFFSVFVFTIFSLIVSTILGLWAGSTADTKKPSYILLTKKSEQYKKMAEKRYNSKWKQFITSIVTGIITGIAANILFTIYWVGNLK